MQQIDQVLIPVETVEGGMFPSERVVKIRGIDGRELALFVDERLIDNRGQQSYLRVTRVEVDPETGISICLLPSATTQGTRWVRFRSAALLEAAA